MNSASKVHARKRHRVSLTHFTPAWWFSMMVLSLSRADFQRHTVCFPSDHSVGELGKFSSTRLSKVRISLLSSRRRAFYTDSPSCVSQDSFWSLLKNLALPINGVRVDVQSANWAWACQLSPVISLFRFAFIRSLPRGFQLKVMFECIDARMGS
jgi:hypothetical protein